MCYNNSRKKAGRYSRPPYGVLAQLGERKVRNLEVRGSIPLCSTRPKASIHAGFDRVDAFLFAKNLIRVI